MPDDNNITSGTKHNIQLLTVSKEHPIRIMSGDQELTCSDVQLPSGIYEYRNGSYLFRGTYCLFQDGEYYNLFQLPDDFTVYGDLNLSGIGLTELPDFSKITVLGTFDCSYNLLKNLKGSPKYAKNYNCSANLELTSLYGATNTVVSFDCSVCPRLLSLEYIPYAKIYSINGNPQLSHTPSRSAKMKSPLGALLFEALPDEFDVLNVQDGPANINIIGKKIKIIDVGYNYRRTNLCDMPESADQVIYDHCANLTENAIKEYNRRRRTYLELQRQTELEF